MSPTPTHSLRRLLRLMHPPMAARNNSRTIHTLVEVSMNPGLSMEPLTKSTGLSIAGVHRNIEILIRRGLLRTELRKVNGTRIIFCYCTPEGDAMVAKLTNVIAPAAEPV